MINYKGYYINLVKKEFDSRVNDNLIGINAFIFYKNYTYKILSKQEYSNQIVDFCISNLLDESNINGVFSENKNIITLKPNEKYGNKYTIKILDENKLYNSISKSKMFFVSWNEHMEIKGVKNSKNILKKYYKLKN